ncbi:MAG: hypothetical protein EOS82_03445 [Mesorhizobium sp.]|uniref:hypothetical protein n=1 Tax=Mesorhizobium sp. TaxID=1871066 RepID=UPI000FE8BC0A|nr:hypothetical protein [Mesorhizobium sp.]RWQ56561.1 MAG: hypothetical protein EOS82_03445 [Mesorhizobium sp.]
MKTGRVIKAFPFAFDGINIEHLAVGRPVSLPENTFEGLEKAGYLEADKAATTKLPEDEQINRDLIDTLDRKLSAASDQDLKDIIARSGTPYSGNLVHASLVLAAKRQLLREMQGTAPITGIDPNAGVTEQPLAKPGEATPPSAAASVEQQQAAADAAKRSESERLEDAKRDDGEKAKGGAGENKATNQFGDPLPAGGAKPKADFVDLDTLKKDELEKLAADRGVDISAAKTKADIINAINAGKSA